MRLQPEKAPCIFRYDILRTPSRSLFCMSFLLSTSSLHESIARSAARTWFRFLSLFTTASQYFDLAALAFQASSTLRPKIIAFFASKSAAPHWILVSSLACTSARAAFRWFSVSSSISISSWTS